MTTAIKRRRGTTTQHSTFTGLEGEITVDTTKDTLVVHDGATAGGFALLREDLSNNTNVITTTNTKTLTNKTFGDNPTFSAGTANGIPYLNGSKVLTTGSALTFDGTNLLLGTATSTALSSGQFQVGTTSADSAIQMLSSTTGTSGVYFGDGTTGDTRYRGGIEYGHNGDSLRFYASSAEQMRLTSTGLGIGTSSPSAKLDVNGTGLVSSFGSNTVAETYVQVKNGTSTLYLGGSSSYNYVYGTASVPLTFWTNSAERMRLDSSGNLGLGVTPSAWNSSYKAVQLGSATSLWGIASGVGGSFLSNNVYFDGTPARKYLVSSYASEYAQASGTHAWFTAPSGTAGNAISFTQAMTLDASGNLSIGATSNPTSAVLNVNGAGGICLDTQGTQTEKVIYFRYAGAGGGAVLKSDGIMSMWTGSTVVAPAERMRIDSSGRVLVGTSTAPSGGGNDGVKGVCISPGDPSSVIIQNKSDANMYLAKVSGYTLGDFVQFYVNGTQVGKIYTDGTTTTYATSSDYRLKENIQPMQNALATVAQLNPVTYTWKADGSDGQGFIAHELQAVVPDCVTGEKDAVRIVDVLDDEGRKIGTKEEPVYQGIDTSFLVATLTKAIQELKAEVDSLKSQLENK